MEQKTWNGKTCKFCQVGSLQWTHTADGWHLTESATGLKHKCYTTPTTVLNKPIRRSRAKLARLLQTAANKLQ